MSATNPQDDAADAIDFDAIDESIPGNIDWRHSEAKEIILSDLETGLLPLEASDVSAREAWDLVYSHLPAFITPAVPYSQFVNRLRDHRRQVKRAKQRSLRELQVLRQERQLFPRETHNQRGEPVFDLSPAKPLLRDDIKMKRHEGMTPSEFQQTRPEYKQFKKTKFKFRIYQEIRRQKFVNYLESKQAKIDARNLERRQSNLYR